MLNKERPPISGGWASLLVAGLATAGGAVLLSWRHGSPEIWLVPWVLCSASIGVRTGALAWLAAARASTSGGIGWELAVIGARFAASVLLFALSVVLFPETRPEIPWIWLSSFLILLALELYLFAQGDHRR